MEDFSQRPFILHDDFSACDDAVGFVSYIDDEFISCYPQYIALYDLPK
jgi:hypothetical protein